MKKSFTFIFGLLVGVTITILLYQYGFEFLIRHFNEAISFYILFGIVLIIILVFGYFKINKWITKVEEELEFTEELNLNDIIQNKKWNELTIFIRQINKKISLVATKWGIATWIFRTIQIIILGFVGIFGSILIMNQNELLKHQNYRLDQQTHLIESERRSSLVFLFSNIMDAIDRELTTDYNENEIRDLSPQLIGRIIALANRLRPYYYMEGDSLIDSPLSPERAQLLVSLVEAKLDEKTFNEIKMKSDFSFSNLENADLSNTDLSHAKLNNSNLKNCKLYKSTIIAAYLNYCNLENANLDDSDLTETTFENSNLKKSKLRRAFTYTTNFNGANLKHAVLYKTKLETSFFVDTKLDSLDVEKTFLDDMKNFKEDSILGLSNILNSYSLDSFQYKPNTLTNKYRVHYILKKNK